MAIVADLSGNYPVSLPTGADQKLAKWNRSNAGAPSGSLTPLYPGEVVLDTTNRMLWRATDTSANTSWLPYSQVSE